MRALVIHGKWVEKSGEATPCVIVRERAPAGRPFFLSYCESFRELRRRRTGWKVLRKSSDSGNALVCTLRVPDVRSRGRRESLVYSQRRTRPVVRGISGLSPPPPWAECGHAAAQRCVSPAASAVPAAAFLFAPPWVFMPIAAAPCLWGQGWVWVAGAPWAGERPANLDMCCSGHKEALWSY